MFKRILLPVDGSENSARALEYTVEIAKKFNSQVIILHSFNMPLQEYVPFNFDTKDLEADIFKTGNEILKHAENMLIEAGIKVISFLKDGSAGFMIINTCEAERCDSIIMGSRGHSSVKSLLIGSASNYVVHHTKIPVCLVQ